MKVSFTGDDRPNQSPYQKQSYGLVTKLILRSGIAKDIQSAQKVMLLIVLGCMLTTLVLWQVDNDTIERVPPPTPIKSL